MVLNLDRWKPFPNLLYRAESWIAGLNEAGEPAALLAAWEREVFAQRPFENAGDRLRGPEEVMWKAMWAMYQVALNYGGGWVRDNFFMQDKDVQSLISLKQFIEVFEDSLSRRKAPVHPSGTFQIKHIPKPQEETPKRPGG